MKILLNILKYLPIIEAKGVIKRRYQHPDAVSYTPESKDGLMLLIKPSFSFANMRASALSLVQRSTSMYFAEHKGLSKNFSFWTVSLDLDAMFKIKSLLYKDLILNSRGCRKSNQLLRHPLVSA